MSSAIFSSCAKTRSNGLCGRVVVELEHSAEPRPAPNGPRPTKRPEFVVRPSLGAGPGVPTRKSDSRPVGTRRAAIRRSRVADPFRGVSDSDVVAYVAPERG